MKPTIFDGRVFAEEIAKRLSDEVTEITKEKGRKPKLVTVLDPNNRGSVVYTNLKAKMAQRLGVDFQIVDASQITNLNNDPTVDGIMIQMPMANSQELISQIDPKKDVDGLREDSPYLPAAVVAVKKILDHALCLTPTPLLNSGEGKARGEVVVVGSTGMIGKALVKLLTAKCQLLIPMHKSNFDPEKLKNADVIISATGVQNLITEHMVKPGAICIDVGYPKGDFSPECNRRASFITPVPGGVGPVTVVCLFENLLKSLGK